MGKIFDMDSPVMRFLGRVGDLLILNLIMIVCCLPIITVGASFTAMHYVLLKMVRGEDGYLVRGFFKSFKSNFRQATILWLIMLVIIGIYAGDLWIFNHAGLGFPKAFMAAVAAVAVIGLLIAMYIFPILSRFDNTVLNTIKNAALMSFLNLPRTLLMVVVYALPFIIAYFSTYSILLVLMFGYTAPAYGAAWLYSDIFKKFEPEAEVVSDMDFTVKMEENEGDNGESE